MAESGRYHRKPNLRLIPVAELLAAQKRIRYPDPAAQPEPIAPEPPSPQPEAPDLPLLAGQPPASQPGASQPPSQVHVDELLRRELQRVRLAATPGQPPSMTRRGRRRSLVLGAAAATVLCGALGVAGVIVGHDAPAPAPPTAAPEHITGAKVFRPDVIKASLRGGGAGGQDGGGSPAGEGTGAGATATGGNGQQATTDGGRQATTGDSTDAPGRSGQEGVGGGPQGQPGAAGTSTGTTEAPSQQPAPPGQPAPATTSGAEPLTPGSDPALNTILRFYATAPTQPAIAFELLHPSVQDGTLAEFAASWQGISSALVLSATPDGTHAMTVRVLLLRADATTLLTTQRIEVRGGARPRIVDARLLSASAG